MAEGQEDRDTEDLSEEASPFRLEEFRNKGQVSQSRELSALAAFLAAAATCWALSPKMGSTLLDLMREVFNMGSITRLDFQQTGVVASLLMKCLKVAASLVVPVALAGFFMGAFTSFAQIGAIFSTDPLTPDFAKINPLSGIKRLFSMRHAIESVSIILKSIVLITAVVLVVKTQVLQSIPMAAAEPASLVETLARAARAIVLPVIVILIVFGVIDFALNRWEYMKQLRLTKEEAKQESKEREGDPQIKARVRAIARERARRRMMEAVKKADVIVTNPTHIAIAIQYDKDKMAAPKVIAKGADFLAQKIKKIAAEAGVPLVENVPLARTLYKTVKVGQFIPRALYQAVAEVLAHVYRLRGRM